MGRGGTEVRLTLVSASPRRRELLAGLGHPFDVRPSDAPEYWSGPTATAVAERNARVKIERSSDSGDRSRLLVGADTLIEVDGLLLGKPLNRSSAERMLNLLSGRTHHVITGICLSGPAAGDATMCPVVIGSATSAVEVDPLPPSTLERYLCSKEWVGKAGAYAIQGQAGEFCRLHSGARDNVIGLPLTLIDGLLRTHFSHCCFC